MPRPMYGPTRHRQSYRNGPAEQYDVPTTVESAEATDPGIICPNCAGVRAVPSYVGGMAGYVNGPCPTCGGTGYVHLGGTV